MVRLIGTLLMIGSLISDYSYIFKQTFSSKLYLLLYVVVLLTRILIPVLLMVRYLCVKVVGEKNKLSNIELDRVDKLQSQKG